MALICPSFLPLNARIRIRVQQAVRTLFPVLVSSRDFFPAVLLLEIVGGPR
jgi:hypothetical protein